MACDSCPSTRKIFITLCLLQFAFVLYAFISLSMLLAWPLLAFAIIGLIAAYFEHRWTLLFYCTVSFGFTVWKAIELAIEFTRTDSQVSDIVFNIFFGGFQFLVTVFGMCIYRSLDPKSAESKSIAAQPLSSSGGSTGQLTASQPLMQQQKMTNGASSAV